jgi:hypothetical protein
MRILAGMTGIAICWRSFEDALGMTIGTGNTCVFPGQWKGTVIKIGRLPGCGCMADQAICAQLTLMFVILFVAGIAVGRSAFVYVINMATGTNFLDVFTRQLEGSQVVVESCRQPAFRGVAILAACSKLIRMWIIFQMTNGTIGWQTTQVCDAASIRMALRTCGGSMYSG